VVRADGGVEVGADLRGALAGGVVVVGGVDDALVAFAGDMCGGEGEGEDEGEDGGERAGCRRASGTRPALAGAVLG